MEIPTQGGWYRESMFRGNRYRDHVREGSSHGQPRNHRRPGQPPPTSCDASSRLGGAEPGAVVGVHGVRARTADDRPQLPGHGSIGQRADAQPGPAGRARGRRTSRHPVVGSADGSARLAAKAVGSDTRTWVKLTESYRPDPWRGQEYTQWYEEYHQQYRSVKDQYKHIATLPERGK